MQGFADFFDGLLGGVLQVALSIALGGATFALLVVPRDADALTGRLRASAATLLAGAAGGLVVCQVAGLGLKILVLAADLGPVAFERFPGTLQFRAGLARAACAAALALAAIWAARKPDEGAPWVAVVALCGLTAIAGAWLVHAAGRIDGRAPLMTATVLHQVTAGIWAGGLVHLCNVWRLGRRDEGLAVLWPRTVARFSTLALASVAALVAFALPLAWTTIGSWSGLVGTGYGSLVLTKVGLLGAVLLIAGFNLVAVRAFQRHGRDGTLRSRVPFLVEAEALLAIVLLFTAASLSSQPPARDVADRATVAEVVEVFRPKWPSLRTPSIETMRRNTADPYAAVGGERTAASYSWSNFSHNVAGVALLAMGVLALASSFEWRWARNWPLGFVLLGAFVFLRSMAVDGIWPFGSRGFWDSTFASAEDLQHRLAGLLATTLGLVEWRARRGGGANRLAYVFPILATAGGLLLLVHSHAAFEQKSSYLVQVTHSTMGALAVLLACGRLLELRLGPPIGRLAGIASTVVMLLIALVLVFYREANVVVAPDAVAPVPADARFAGGGTPRELPVTP